MSDCSPGRSYPDDPRAPCNPCNPCTLQHHVYVCVKVRLSDHMLRLQASERSIDHFVFLTFLASENTMERRCVCVCIGGGMKKNGREKE